LKQARRAAGGRQQAEVAGETACLPACHAGKVKITSFAPLLRTLAAWDDFPVLAQRYDR
jgi:hypothetical protein